MAKLFIIIIYYYHFVSRALILNSICSFVCLMCVCLWAVRYCHKNAPEQTPMYVLSRFICTGCKCFVVEREGNNNDNVIYISIHWQWLAGKRECLRNRREFVNVIKLWLVFLRSMTHANESLLNELWMRRFSVFRFCFTHTGVWFPSLTQHTNTRSAPWTRFNEFRCSAWPSVYLPYNSGMPKSKIIL